MSWVSRLLVPLVVLILPIGAAIGLLFFAGAPAPRPPASVQVGESPAATPVPSASPDADTVPPPGPVDGASDDDDDDNGDEGDDSDDD